ncbi:glutamate 5-kinase [Acinetobacter pittii]|uniref:glutamate 5-kinase n=1 Tax=Acinetobacter pittii TaxID=48296 RepID=UPI00355AEDB1
MRAKIQSKLGKAFSTKLADAVDTFTCTRKKLTGSNPAKGEDTYTEINYSGRGVRGNYLEQRNLPIDYKSSDIRFLGLQNELTETPLIGDKLIFSDGGYSIISIQQDPAKVTWVLQIRKV